MNLLTKFINSCRQEGARRAILRSVQVLLGLPGDLEEKRLYVRASLEQLHGLRVAYGPFAGMKLSTDVWWGGQFDAVKILGCYESIILRTLEDISIRDGVLIDIGAADGYFAIGSLRAGFFGRAICYEASERGRAALATNASRNGVMDRIEIRGAADSVTLQTDFVPNNRGVVLCDVEGMEFDLLDAGALENLRGMHVIVELHPHLVDEGPRKRAALLERAEQFFSVRLLRSDDPAPSQFRELDDLPDDLRYLAFSEGRGRAGEWALLVPRE
jgi:hypothetical protein